MWHVQMLERCSLHIAHDPGAGISRNFLSRKLLEATSLSEALVTLVETPGQVWGGGLMLLPELSTSVVPANTGSLRMYGLSNTAGLLQLLPSV
jgi:hypothetical protein